MVKNTIVEISDDIDGSPNAQEVTFSFQGDDYVIDLSKKNVAAFEKALKPFVQAATKAPKARTRNARATRSTPRKSSDLAAVRTWAREAGIEISDRGRVPKAVLEQYHSANGKQA